MANRVIAIGDIHGCSRALRVLLEAIQPDASDTLVTLGDYVNRGPDSRGVLDELIRLRESCRLVPLLGNHDQLLLHNRASRSELPGGPIRDPENGLELFRDEHFAFLESCRLYYEIDTHFFVHANYQADKPLSDQDIFIRLWCSLETAVPKRHRSGKIAILGHTSQRSGEILNRGHFLCIDTYCYGGGWLTALDIRSGHTWQFNKDGMIRGRDL